ncbi:HNH endonuclease [Salmonella enterica subsp. enterica]|nr:HNH endonuclease [Salmonella enterica subsp. enterica serovar Farmsen]
MFRLKTTGEVFRPEADCPENIFPSCAPCNLLKTTYSLEMFRKQVSLQVERGRRSSVNFRTAERFWLISVVNKPVVFWFEQYEGENK